MLCLSTVYNYIIFPLRLFIWIVMLVYWYIWHLYNHWLKRTPPISTPYQESEWLRVTLHKWLDDEYCPEPANVDISNTAARSYHESLTTKQSDLGEILLKMVGDLQELSYQESFHGAFSAANAAVRLITQRMDSSSGEWSLKDNAMLWTEACFSQLGCGCSDLIGPSIHIIVLSGPRLIRRAFMGGQSACFVKLNGVILIL